MVDPGGQAPAHLLAFACLSGVVQRGLDDRYWLLAPDDGEDPRGVTELFHRYLGAYGPATVEDFVTWSGLRAADCRGLDLDGLRDTGFGFVLPGTEPAEPVGAVALLGHSDTYLLGYRDRSLALDPAYAPRIQTGGGFLTPHVVLDGRVVGTWKRSGGELVLAPFEPGRGRELRRLLGEDTR